MGIFLYSRTYPGFSGNNTFVRDKKELVDVCVRSIVDSLGGRLDSHLRDEFTKAQMSLRILFELNRCRSGTMLRSFAFIRSNRKIIRQYFGLTRLMCEVADNVASPRCQSRLSPPGAGAS